MMCNVHVVTFWKPSLALDLSGRAKLRLQTWQDGFQEAATDERFLLMPQRETTKSQINRKDGAKESEV